MGKLTTSTYELYPCLDCNKKDECYGEEWCIHIRRAIFRLANYEKLEDQGRLIKLPCKAGDTVYIIYKNQILECTVYGIHIDFKYSFFEFLHKGEFLKSKNLFLLSDFGKTVFLTEQEALEAKERTKHEK